MKKYRPVRLPEEAYNNLIAKKIKMQNTIRSLTGKNIKVPLTNILIEMSRNPLELQDERLFKMRLKKR